jgi:methionyl-tRNA formyltransferase
MAANTTDGRISILIITEDDPIYVVKFFDVFFDQLPRDRIDIVGMTISRAFAEPLIKTARRMWRFYGAIDFLRLLTRYARARVLRRESIARIAERNHVPLIWTTSVNATDYVERVRQLAPDVIISVAAPEVFKKPLLSSAKLCLNIHSGRLPHYRGMMPVFWQLRNEEEQVTVTIHEMAAKLDAGRVFATRTFPLRKHDVLDRVITETKQGGATLMIDTLTKLDKLIPESIDIADGNYFGFPQPSDVAAFRSLGHRLL